MLRKSCVSEKTRFLPTAVLLLPLLLSCWSANAQSDGATDSPTTTEPTPIIDAAEQNSTSSSQATQRPVELALVMDVGNLMRKSGKLSEAKDLATSLINTVYGGDLWSVLESNYVRLALVPFSGSVRLNQKNHDFNLDWIDTTGSNPLSRLNFSSPTWNNYMAWNQLKLSDGKPSKWNGCVEARMRRRATSGVDYALDDIVPSIADPVTLFPVYFAPDVPGNAMGTNYIGADGEPNENTGLTGDQKSDMSSAGFLLKQKNQKKYKDRVIAAETRRHTDGPWAGCPKSAIVPLTYHRLGVEGAILLERAMGPTIIAEGIAWGMRVLSPTEPFTLVEGSESFPDDKISRYDDPRWRKVMVLFVYGENDVGASAEPVNGSIYSAYGRRHENLHSNRFGTTTETDVEKQLNRAMLDACDKVKDTGTELYVISFAETLPQVTQSRLESCASDPTHYKKAHRSDMDGFFRAIALGGLN